MADPFLVDDAGMHAAEVAPVLVPPEMGGEVQRDDTTPGAVEAFKLAEAADPENESYRTRRRLAEARAR